MDDLKDKLKAWHASQPAGDFDYPGIRMETVWRGFAAHQAREIEQLRAERDDMNQALRIETADWLIALCLRQILGHWDHSCGRLPHGEECAVCMKFGEAATEQSNG